MLFGGDLGEFGRQSEESGDFEQFEDISVGAAGHVGADHCGPEYE